MTAAHVMNDKSLVVTFETSELALRFVRFCKRRLGFDVYAHDDRRVMLVDDADSVDRMAIELQRDRRVSAVCVDWYLG